MVFVSVKRQCPAVRQEHVNLGTDDGFWTFRVDNGCLDNEQAQANTSSSIPGHC